jgi:hypothetical protein
MPVESKVYKTSVNLTEEAVAALREIAEKRGQTMADVIRHAIATEKFVHETTSTGGKILVEGKDRQIRQVIFQR